MQPLVTNGEEGLLVEAYDCEAFADAMLRISTDEALRKQMGIKAAGKSKQFSMDCILQQWREALTEMIGA